MPKILVFASNPKDMMRLHLGEEARDIREGLQLSSNRDQFTVVEKWAVRPRDFQRAMLDVKPEIVHFSGHGSGETGICLEGPTGETQLVTGEALADLFELFADTLQCVVLNGCYSEVQAQEIATHVPYVIGMNQAVGDKAAIEFAVGFYDALGAGQTIARAFKFGQVAMNMAGIGEIHKPVLLTMPHDVQSTFEDICLEKELTKRGTRVNAQVLESKASTPAVLGAELSGAGADDSLSANGAPLKVFMAYSHQDEGLKEELEVHLSMLRRQQKIQAWTAGAIEAGLETEPLIADQLEASQIILLLVTPRFMASDDIFDTQLKRAMERHRERTARVIPIRLKRVDYEGAEFEILKPLPAIHEPPVNQWADQDEAFAQVVQGIRQVVESLATTTGVTSQAHRPSKEQSPATGSSSAVSRPAVDVAMIQKRKDLAQFLSGLSGPQFNMLVSILLLPAGILSAPSAPQANRVAELIQWAEGATGFGLNQLEAITQDIINSQ